LQIPFFQVAAFTDSVFGGNPAAFYRIGYLISSCRKLLRKTPLQKQLCVVVQGRNYKIRWFTPEIEMDLCGHATLATAHVIVRLSWFITIWIKVFF